MEARLAGAIEPAAVVCRSLGGDEERVAHPVHTRDARERVVHGRAERADGNLDDLRDAELGILLEGAVSAEATCARHVGGIGTAIEATTRGQGFAAKDELTRTEEHVNDGLCGRGFAMSLAWSMSWT